MGQNRREFLRTTMVGAGWAAFGTGCATFDSCAEAIRNRPTRRDIDTLAADSPILVAYRSAITQMKALPASDKRSWQYQATIHNDHCPHGNWFFLPWHRAYLVYFERICRKLSGMPDFALPYWNWSKDAKIPAAFWGDPSNALFDSNRNVDATTTISASFVGASVVGPILDEPNFEVFGSAGIGSGDDQRTRATQGRLESTPHNHVHSTIGGDMGAFMSPLDPVFWSHHNMIERCWVEWNLVRNHPNTDDTAWLDRTFTEFVDEDGNPVTVTVRESLLFPIFSYQYDDTGTLTTGSGTGGSPAPPAGDRGARSSDEEWRKINHPSSAAEQQRSARRAQSGATVRLEILQRFAAQGAITAAIAKPASIPIAFEPKALRAAIESPEQRTLLYLNDVDLDHTSDFSVKVFVDKPDASVDTPDSDPHFVGAFAFFNHVHQGGHGGGAGSFVLDATPALKRLGQEPNASLTVDLVLMPFAGREPKTRELTVGSAELRVVHDVIERHDK